jgi:hypothetical protein
VNSLERRLPDLGLRSVECAGNNDAESHKRVAICSIIGSRLRLIIFGIVGLYLRLSWLSIR